MGVSLGYSSTLPVEPVNHQQLLSLAAESNKAYDWWCESIWISNERNEKGMAFGSTKLFRMIDDENVDTYMAYLDVCEIIKFLKMVSVRLGIEWEVKIEGAPFGGVTRTGADTMLRGNIATFLDMFPGDFEPLKAKPRAEILAEWAGQ